MTSFRSKFGFEIFIFIIVLFAVVFVLSFNNSETPEALLAMSAIFLLIIVCFLYMNLSTRYSINETNQLVIKMGIFYKKTIAINSIKSVRRSSNLLSSPAPSLDRLELNYAQFGQILISPKNKNEFVTALVKLNPKIRVEFDLK